MGERKDNFIIAIILLGLTALGVLFVTNLKKIPVPESKLLDFPMQVGLWSGKNLPMDKRVFEILGTDKVLLREYTSPKNEKVWLAVVYGEQNRQSFHPPEYCYLGGGNVELLDKEKIAIKINKKESMNVNRLLFQMGKYKQLVLYWFTAGNKMTENYYKQQIYFVLDEIKYRKSSGTLIRVSTTVINDDTKAALERSERFVREVLKLLPSYL
ncbi:MAG: hypothetical protein AMJ78_05755 [Omnitrophica WOR_2 bacterium SM23_29]|nr:MAG: hypothetical protein AMJ78_05755 [Omnitrophica WOR_2 bacterium SM23_29]